MLALSHLRAAARGAAVRQCGALRSLHLTAAARAKPSVANIKVIRQRTGLPMTLVRQALLESGNDVDGAVKWLGENEEARAE